MDRQRNRPEQVDGDFAGRRRGVRIQRATAQIDALQLALFDQLAPNVRIEVREHRGSYCCAFTNAGRLSSLAKYALTFGWAWVVRTCNRRANISVYPIMMSAALNVSSTR